MHATYSAELTTVRDQLKAGFSASPNDPAKEPGPSTAELAKKVKALRSANNIEAMPQCVRDEDGRSEPADRGVYHLK